MRRILLGLTLLLPGCDLAGNPLAGFGGFVGDTHTIYRDPNEPVGDSVNMQRAMGGEAPSEPLLPEPGNVWPGPPAPEPTLADIQRQQGIEMQTAPGEEFPRTPPPRGSSTPPELLQPLPAPQLSPPPQGQPSAPPTSSIQPPASVVVQTQRGPAVITTDANGVQTFIMPDGSSGRVVSNGNGTLTLIGADGRVQSVQAPR